MENAVQNNPTSAEREDKLKYVYGRIDAELKHWAADWSNYDEEVAEMSLADYLEYKRVRKNAFWSAKFEALPNKDLDRLEAIYRVVRYKHRAFLLEAERIRTMDALATLRLQNAG